MSSSYYDYPVSELLNYGDCSHEKEWRNYIQELNLEQKHIPELIEMATAWHINQDDLEDQLEWRNSAIKYGLHEMDIPFLISMATEYPWDIVNDNPQIFWSCVHARRALGQLKSLYALVPLLFLLNKIEDDFYWEDLTQICRLIGEYSLPIVEDFLGDLNNSLYAKSEAARIVTILCQENRFLNERGTSIILKEFSGYRSNHPSYNANLIDELIDLDAFEAIDLIKEAFNGNFVDTDILADIDTVFIEFGLLPEHENEIAYQKVLKEMGDLPEFDSKIFHQNLEKDSFFQKKKVKVFKGFARLNPNPAKKKSSKSSRKRKKR